MRHAGRSRARHPLQRSHIGECSRSCTFFQYVSVKNVDVEIQNHPIFDDTPARLAAIAARAPGEPHPFVMGAERYQRFWGVVSECMQADIARKSSK